MSRYDGLIIPRSYNEYINKSDPLTLAQALQQNNVLSGAVAAGDNKAVTSSAVASALEALKKKTLGEVQVGGYIDITVPQYKMMLIHTRPYNGGALVIIAVAMYTTIVYNVLINQNNEFTVTVTSNNKLRITNNNTQYPFYIEGITF